MPEEPSGPGAMMFCLFAGQEGYQLSFVWNTQHPKYHVLLLLQFESQEVSQRPCYRNSPNIPEWFALVVNIVGHAGLLTQTHNSRMRSFDVQCTSYNPEAPRKYKSCEFMVRCFFDIRRRWESYELPRAGTLVHIIGQLIGRYKISGNEEPAVLITDFKILVSSGKVNTITGGNSASTETNTPTKQRYSYMIR
jgi:hypothetical protein